MSKLSRHLEPLPSPPTENLTSHFILGEIIDHIHLLQEDFPHVKIHKLQDHLWDIRNKNVDPETHLRGFLHVFEETQVFQDALSELDEGMKRQLKVFMDGGREESVMYVGAQKGIFALPPSPGVKEHFWEIKKEPLDKKKGLRDVVRNVLRLFCIKKELRGFEEHQEIDVKGSPVSADFDETSSQVDGVNGANRSNGVDGQAKIVNGQFDKKFTASPTDFPKIYEDKEETKTMEVYADKEFHNWGLSVQNKPKWTFVPKTVLGLQNLVKWAKDQGKRVRCSGYRHSWSRTFSADNEILVSLLNLEQVTHIPDPMSISKEHIDPANELKSIQLAAPPGVTASSTDKALVRVGVSVTNEQFRRWAVGNDKWTMPVDVILVEVTWGGVNGPICHGAGRRHKTIGDYVRAVEYVDANGSHRTVSDPVHLRAAAGCFGLLGIVTHITFELNTMSYAVLQPIKPDIGLAIPPLKREDIPIALRKTYTNAQYAAALTDFEAHATNDYYSEWFWFTRSQQAWINTWNPTSDRTGVVDYPSPFLTWLQWVEGWLGAVITSNPIFIALPGRWQAELLATLGMVNLPPFSFSSHGQTTPTETIKTALPNALHFRRGIQNMRVRDLEFQIPIPGKKDDETKPDYSVVQKAWWDIINLTYEDADTPMRLTMELRIMGDSNLIMAPQRGNTHGTASIEVLSIPDVVSDGEWGAFLQRVCDLWMSYRDNHGILLNVRPHWAKEWEDISMRGMPAREFLREVAYKDAIPEFKETLASIGELQGWGLKDIKERFSNELWDYLVYSE